MILQLLFVPEGQTPTSEHFRILRTDREPSTQTKTFFSWADIGKYLGDNPPPAGEKPWVMDRKVLFGPDQIEEQTK